MARMVSCAVAMDPLILVAGGGKIQSALESAIDMALTKTNVQVVLCLLTLSARFGCADPKEPRD